MQVKINPDTPGIWGAMLDMENKKSVTGMHQILCESLYSDADVKILPKQADSWLRNMSMNQSNEIGDKFQKAMEALKTQAVPPTGSGPQ